MYPIAYNAFTMATIETYLSSVQQAASLLIPAELEGFVDVLLNVRRNNGTVYTFGNGGSHSTASHFANDLLKVCGVRAVCLGDMVSVSLAFGNDEGWNEMYANMLLRLLKRGDVVVGFTCSGQSENVVSALYAAVKLGVSVVVLTGESRVSPIHELSGYRIVHVASPDVRVVEDVHLQVCHAAVGAVRGRVG